MKRLIATTLISLSGCAQFLPAGSSELSPGRYELRATGNVFSSAAELQGKINKKAAKLCDKKAAKLCDKKAYSYEGAGDFEVIESEVYGASGRIETNYFELTRIVVCSVE